MALGNAPATDEAWREFDIPAFVFDNLDEGVLVGDSDLNLVRFNPAAERLVGGGLHGLTLDAWLAGHQVFDADGLTELTRDQLPMAVALRERRRCEREMLIRSTDGQESWVSIKAMPLTNPEGATHGVMLLIRDVSARRHDEKRLKEQTRLLQSVLEGVANGVVAVDLRGRFLIFNPAARRIMGVEPLDVPPQQWSTHFGIYRADGQTLIDPEALPLARALRGETLRATSLVIKNRVHPEGLAVSSQASPLYDAEGRVSGAITVLRDESEERKAQAELRASEEKFRTIFEACPDLVALNRRADGRYLAVNQRVSEYLGVGPEQVIGRTPMEISAFQKSEELDQLINLLDEQKAVRNFEFALGANGPARIGLLSAVPVKIDGENAILTFTRDITGLKTVQEALRRERLRLNTMLEAQRAVAEIPLESEALMAAVVNQVLYLTGASGGMIALAEADDQLLCRAASGNVPYIPGAIVDKRLGPVWALLDASPIERIADTYHEPRAPRQLQNLHRTAMVAGLRLAGQTIGALIVTADEPGRFDPSDVETCQLVAGRVAMALRYATEFKENKRLLVEREAALTALAESEERLRRFFADSHVGLLTIGVDGTFLEVNEAFCRSSGYSAQELRKLNLRQIIHPDDRSSSMASFQRLVAGELPHYRIDNRNVTRDGRSLWLSSSYSAVRDENGRVRYVIASAEDISERKQIEEELAESEAKFRKIFEASLHAICINSYPDGAYLEVNHEFERVYGYERWEVIGRRPAELNQWVSPAALKQAMGDLRRHGVLRNRIATLRRKDGTIFTCLYSWTVTVLNGRPHMVVMSEDITERKLAEDSRALLAAIVASSADAIISTTTDGHVTSWNAAAERLYGYSPPQALNRHFSFLNAKVSRRQLTALRSELMAGGSPKQLEVEVTAADGAPLSVAITLSPITDSGGKVTGFASISRDASERKLAAQARELARSNAELEQFAYVASHDLKEPLRMVGTYSGLLRHRLGQALDPEIQDCLDEIREGVHRMSALIDGLLEYSRLTSRPTTPRLFGAEDALRLALSNLKEAIKGSAAVIECARLPEVSGDYRMLTILFQNLISNAVKFRRQETPRIYVEAAAVQGGWRFGVHDNGIGIDERYVERIFRMFERLHSRADYPGTGIGLAVCKKIVERHNGRIWVESTLGHGSSFYFILPA